METLVLGSLSGLQDFLFDVSEEGGGQARRLRARSLCISLLAECAARRVFEAVGWTRRELRFCAAGKFLLAGPPLDERGKGKVKAAVAEATRRLLAETGGALRLAVAVCEPQAGESPAAAFERAQHTLLREKWRPWAGLATASGGWDTAALVLPPLLPPCDLCHRRPAEVNYDDDGVSRTVCRRCHGDWRLGRDLPAADWLEVHATAAGAPVELLGFGVWARAAERPSQHALQVFPLRSPFRADDPSVAARPIARHVPHDQSGHPVEFKDLAARSKGMPRLGVLKMDADNLGLAFGRLLQKERSLGSVVALSDRLDGFFAATVDNMMSESPWDSLYVVFSGGDDLLLVGPWNVAFDFAREVARAFASEFANDGLTLSAGLAVVKPVFPIRAAVQQADLLLARAKTERASGAQEDKDQFAAFGQVWKWRDHDVVTDSAQQLVAWVQDQRVMPRGWLHTLLELAEARARREAGPVTARLAYQVGRDFPRRGAFGGAGKLRCWADALLDDFDAGARPETRLLAAILRYAITATRTPGKDHQ